MRHRAPKQRQTSSHRAPKPRPGSGHRAVRPPQTLGSLLYPARLLIVVIAVAAVSVATTLSLTSGGSSSTPPAGTQSGASQAGSSILFEDARQKIPGFSAGTWWNPSNTWIKTVRPSPKPAPKHIWPGHSSSPSPTPSVHSYPTPTLTPTVIPVPTPTLTPTLTPSPTPTRTGGSRGHEKSAATDPTTDPITDTPDPTTHAPAPTTAAPVVSGGRLNCGKDPSSCGFPDSTNTGVPAGVTLTASGPVTANQNGQVISGLRINGCVDVEASNVTIKDDDISDSAPASFCVNIASNVSNTLIEDTSIHGTNSGNGGVEYAIRDLGNGTRLLRVNMYWCTECLASSSASMQDSYIHDLANISGSHYEDIYDGGGSGLSVIHSTLFNQQEQTAAIYMAPDTGDALTNITINDNLLAGGGYTIYGGTSLGDSTSRIAITDNLFSTIYFPACGQFGELAYWSSNGNTWSANTYTDGTQAGQTAS
jgi:hypothetical protein